MTDKPRVIDGKFKKDEPKASDALQAFADMATEVEEGTGSPCEVAIVFLSPYGLTLGGNAPNPEGINLLLDMAKWSVLMAQFEGEVGEDGTIH